MADPPKLLPFEGFSWDARKREANAKKHGLDFAAAQDFNFATALTVTDDRNDYGELREISIGFIGARLHVLVFTRRAPKIHVISLRKANDREEKQYALSTEET
ncbi:MAG: BrnT family toxin [Methylovirgula sp.]